MKTFLKLSISIFISIFFVSCFSKSSSGTIEKPKPELPDDTVIIEHGCIPTASDQKLEVATWNLEHFPKKGITTIEKVAGLIKKMNIDIIALQEIKNKDVLDQLTDYLPGYKSAIAQRSDINLAYIYKTSEISLTNTPYLLKLEENSKYKKALPRAPFVIPIHSKSTNLDILLVNNHYKATTYRDNPQKRKENMERRRAASFLLKDWVDKKHATDNIIILGDLNDEITDERKDNVFQVFIDDKENYHFADRFIAQEKNKKEWSYASFPSHIDHILITNELFDNEEKAYTYRFESCVTGYKQTISDHQPVCLVLKK